MARLAEDKVISCRVFYLDLGVQTLPALLIRFLNRGVLFSKTDTPKTSRGNSQHTSTLWQSNMAMEKSLNNGSFSHLNTCFQWIFFDYRGNGCLREPLSFCPNFTDRKPTCLAFASHHHEVRLRSGMCVKGGS
jgi:hypothetical protein